MECVICGEPALVGIQTDQGPLCREHLFEHAGIPVGEAQEESACRVCRRLIKRSTDAAYLEDAGFFHSGCLLDYLKQQGKCPKHGTDPSTCGCWGDPIENLVAQAEKDAQSAWMAGGKHELCFMCLRFNRATTTGLPFYSREPERASMVCGACFKPICEDHYANPPENNILDLSTKEVYCNSGWTGGCYQDLEARVACAFEHCETTQSNFRDEEFDPLTDSDICEDCGAYYCNYISGHEQCPECSGYQCDECDKVFPKEYLHSYQEDSYSFKDLCESCLEEQQSEDEERAFDDYFVSDFKRAIVLRFRMAGIDLDIDDVDDELFESIIREAMEECSIYVEHHSEGPHLDMYNVAVCVDPFAVLALPGTEAEGHRAGPNAPLTRKVRNAANQMRIEFQRLGDWRATANLRKYSYEKTGPQPMTRKRRARMRENFRRQMKRPFWVSKEKRKQLKRAPKTVKGMRQFLRELRPEQRALFSQALIRENPYHPQKRLRRYR